MGMKLVLTIKVLVSCADKLPNLDNHKKVITYRTPTKSQKTTAVSVMEASLLKHFNKDETFWMPLPDKPNIKL